MASIRRTSPQGIAAQLDLTTDLKVLVIVEGNDITDTLWNSATTLADFTYSKAPGAGTVETAGSVTLTAVGSQVILDHAAVTYTTLAVAAPAVEHILYALDLTGAAAETDWVPLLCVDAAAQPDGTNYLIDPGAGLVIWETDSE
jgi:hypothetical protein